ncbi:MAG: ATP-binding protein [Myxococcota bacterium]
MRFLDREQEMGRLDGLKEAGGALGVVFGRRRVGKTRLLVEWVKRHRGLYFVADQSAAEVQRSYFAETLAARLPGFADVSYPDWRVLLTRLSREARAESWKGPLVLDELPYLVQSAPELPAVLQRWIDHEAQDLVIVLAGSSQHMMQGLVLDGGAPLYGRASVLLDLPPLPASLLGTAFGLRDPAACVAQLAAWGGIPRYWELAAGLKGDVAERVDQLVLDPLGPLHREPDRLIIEEVPSAMEVRPVLDAIGGGAHRVSAIGSRLGRPATSMARPLQRLQGMGLVARDVPFGESEKSSRRGLYRISDPLTRLWFRLVAPHRGPLATASAKGRRQLFDRHWPGLAAVAWEDLCRQALPKLTTPEALREAGPWGPAHRWWRGQEPEWDLVAASLDGQAVLLGEVKLSGRRKHAERLARLDPPPLPPKLRNKRILRALFTVEPMKEKVPRGVLLVTAADILRET